MNLHEYQKRLANFIAYLIRIYSNPGDTVLDNCMGSGTTAVACVLEGRHFVGFEINNEYFINSIKRIENIKKQLSLF